MTNTVDSTPLWKPNPATVGDTRMAQFMQATGHGSYANLWQWSVDQPGAFWATVWKFCGALGEPGGTVLAEGPKDFPDHHEMQGTCEAPFEDFQFLVDIEDGSSGVPYKVAVSVQHVPTGDTWTIETLIAAKLGDEPDPPRTPVEPIDREQRYRDQEEAERNG